MCEYGGQTYELRYTSQFDSAQALNQVICLGFDVSGLQISEGSWQASEKRFLNAFSHAAIGFALIGIDGRFIRTNPALISTLGRSEEDLKTITTLDLLLRDDRKNWLDAVHQLLAEAASDVVIEVRFQSPQGEPRWLQINLSVVRDEKNHPLYYFCQYQDIHERKIAEQSLQQYTERLKFIHQLDKSILAARSLKEVGKAIVEEIPHLIPCQRASVTLFDPEKKIGSYLAVFSRTKLEQGDLEEFQFSDEILEYFQDKGVRHVANISKLENPSSMEKKLLSQGINTYLNVPLGLQGVLFGTLNIGAEKPDFFTNKHLEIASELADPLAVAIHQSRLDDQLSNHSRILEQRIEDLRASERYLATLNDITRAALQSHDFNKMLHLLADRISELFKSDGCFITLWDEAAKTATPVAAIGPYRDALKTLGKFPGEGTMTESVLNAEVALVANDIKNSPYISPKIAALSKTKTVLGLPLIAGRKKLGAALIAYDQLRQFSPEEIVRGEQTANHIALAIAKAQLLEAERRRRQEAETLRIVTDALVSTLDLDQVLDLILDQLAVVIDYDSASIMLWEGEQVRCVAGRGFANPEEVIGKLFPTKDSLFSQILETGQALWLNDPKHDPRFSGWGGTDAIRSWMALPLIAHGKFVAYMTLDSFVPEAYGPAAAAMVQPFANQAAQAIENARLFDWVQRQAVTDSLTGLYNRRGLFDIGQREVERAHRFERPLTAIMLDIDLFKKVNDRYGHSTGDQVLCVIAERCAKELRKMDLFARYGGEEFAVLLPETELPAAEAIAERLRQCIGDHPIKTNRDTHTITISLGVAEITPDIQDLTDLLDTADQALYTAKQGGRNCVVVSKMT